MRVLQREVSVQTDPRGAALIKQELSKHTPAIDVSTLDLRMILAGGMVTTILL